MSRLVNVYEFTLVYDTGLVMSGLGAGTVLRQRDPVYDVVSEHEGESSPL